MVWNNNLLNKINFVIKFNNNCIQSLKENNHLWCPKIKYIKI